jgi:hypothetical protein
MKNLITIILILSFGILKAQNSGSELDKIILDIKSQSKSDKNDKVALDIIISFYNDVLQSDKGELENTTVEKLQKFMASNDSRNKHLITIFLMYQQHISETAAVGSKPDSGFQVDAMNILEKEFKDLYGIIPPIIFIYKSEALNSDKKFEEAKRHVKEGLKKYPSSIPLKVYRYMDTMNEQLKSDLVKNHANHWLVLQNNIR